MSLSSQGAKVVIAIATAGSPNYPEGSYAPPTLDPATGAIRTYLVNGGSGGTASTFAALFPLVGTAIGFLDPGGLMAPGNLDASGNLKVAGTLTTTPPTSSTIASAGPTTVGTSSALALAANSSRVQFVLQNVGTTPLYILLGAGTASSSNYTFILPAGGSTRDGSSPRVLDPLWKGAVQWASASAGGLGVISEET